MVGLVSVKIVTNALKTKSMKWVEKSGNNKTNCLVGSSDAKFGYLPIYAYQKCLGHKVISDQVQDTGPPEPMNALISLPMICEYNQREHWLIQLYYHTFHQCFEKSWIE